jgi:hypothetical protein
MHAVCKREHVFIFDSANLVCGFIRSQLGASQEASGIPPYGVRFIPRPSGTGE